MCARARVHVREGDRHTERQEHRERETETERDRDRDSQTERCKQYQTVTGSLATAVKLEKHSRRFWAVAMQRSMMPIPVTTSLWNWAVLFPRPWKRYDVKAL